MADDDIKLEYRPSLLTVDGCKKFVDTLDLVQITRLRRSLGVYQGKYSTLARALCEWAKKNKPKGNHPYPKWEPWKHRKSNKGLI